MFLRFVVGMFRFVNPMGQDFLIGWVSGINVPSQHSIRRLVVRYQNNKNDDGMSQTYVYFFWVASSWPE
jgi:hypothetical protein